MKILLDTNFLMAVTQFKIDIFKELRGHELYTIQPVIKELNKHAKRKGIKGLSAKISLELIKKKNIKILRVLGNADNMLVKYSIKYAVATQDIALRKRLKGTKMYIRQRKYIVIQ